MLIRKTMTAKAIAANQVNGRRGRGATTMTGKKRSSFNALKHAFFSRELAISEKDRPEFETVRRLLFLELAPSTVLQTIAAEEIVACWWRAKLALRLEARRLESLSTKPEELSSDQTDSAPNANAVRWCGASREDLRAGLRLLQILRSDVAENGGLHLDDWKEVLVKNFGPDFYTTLEQWAPMSVDAIRLAQCIVAKEKRFNLEPALEPPASGVKIVVDESQKLQMLVKLVDLETQFLLALRVTSVQTAQNREVLTDFFPRHFPSVSRDLERAVDWFLFLKSNSI